MEERNQKKNPRNLFANVNIKKPNLSSLPMKDIVVCAAIALCVIICLTTAISVSGLKKSVDNLSSSVTQSINELTIANQDLSDRISVVESAINMNTSAVNENNSSRYITITKQPESVSTSLGRDEALVFSVKATGTAISYSSSFSWEKYDTTTSSWIKVPFDSDGFCTEYGLRLYNYYEKDTTTVQVSCIYAKSITSSAFGTYRCVITDTAGSSVTSDTVNLSQKSA